MAIYTLTEPGEEIFGKLSITAVEYERRFLDPDCEGGAWLVDGAGEEIVALLPGTFDRCIEVIFPRPVRVNGVKLARLEGDLGKVHIYTR